MTNIRTISTQELKDDLAAARTDINVCELAILHDVITYSGGLVSDRQKTNDRHVELITKELLRRKLEANNDQES